MASALERAARAVWDSVCLTNDDKSGGYVGTMRDAPFYVDGFVDPAGIVRAVLTAVRDSTDAMNVSAEEAELPGGQFGEPGFRESSIDELDAPVIWRAMIDAILNEKDTTND